MPLRSSVGLGFPRALRDVVLALVDVRLLEAVGDRYRLSTLLFELGVRGSVERRLVEVATSFLADLYERTRETVHLGVREHLDVVYISKMADMFRGGAFTYRSAASDVLHRHRQGAARASR